jgi:hypothetical protein
VRIKTSFILTDIKLVLKELMSGTNALAENTPLSVVEQKYNCLHLHAVSGWYNICEGNQSLKPYSQILR